MRSNYKKLGDYIAPIDLRNRKLEITNLIGLSIQKKFIPSISNIIGTDMSTYRIIKQKQFAYCPVTSRNGEKITIALYQKPETAIISQAYDIFEITKPSELIPEYLMMWFRRPEFDRYARFVSHGSVREMFDWEEMCNVKLPIPHPDKQKEIVKEYKTIVNRINLNNQLIQKLEKTAQAIYKQWFVEKENNNTELKNLDDLCLLITDGKHGDCAEQPNSGYYFVSVKDISEGEIIYENARQITKKDFEETHKRTKLTAGDILLTNSGTIGRMALVKDYPETHRTTFQKSVAILKPKPDLAPSYFLFSLLRSEIKNIIDLAGGSTQSNLLLGDLRRFKVKYPGQKVANQFESKVIPIFKLLGLKGFELQKLLIIKNLLLSKLATIEN